MRPMVNILETRLYLFIECLITLGALMSFLVEMLKLMLLEKGQLFEHLSTFFAGKLFCPRFGDIQLFLGAVIFD